MEVSVSYAAVALAALLFAGLLGSIESALRPISRARVETMVKDEVSGANALMRVVEHRASHINMLVMLVTVLNVAAAVYASMFFRDLVRSDGWGITATISVVTLAQFGVIGVFARTAGRRNPYLISLKAAQWLVVFNTIFGPLAKILIWVGNIFHPGRDFRDGPYSTEVELREMVDIAQEQGVVETIEHRMIQNIFDLAETYARQVMVPRPEMIWIEGTKSVLQTVRLMVRSGHSRVPVIGESVDEIIGVAYLKDMFVESGESIDPAAPITAVMREPLFIPDSKPLDVLLQEMQRINTHIAILIDEYGNVAGLLTMEDLLEEIVGEITDEYDEDEQSPIEAIDERVYRAQGRLPLDDLKDHLFDSIGYELNFDDEILDSVDTVAGLLSYELGRVPLPGSAVDLSGLRFTAEGGRDRRGRMKVRSVRIEVPDVVDEYQPD
ncbi:hemolysin family protein [Corynebacterium mayonis]|uniref:hemolysin family protein n=1 Tax=Corynebacterium mayonis TaxID=3062461 RepID=UPI00314028AA